MRNDVGEIRHRCSDDQILVTLFPDFLEADDVRVQGGDSVDDGRAARGFIGHKGASQGEVERLHFDLGAGNERHVGGVGVRDEGHVGARIGGDCIRGPAIHGPHVTHVYVGPRVART